MPEPLTVADATAPSGLPLRDAERGLHELVAEYRGHLRVTDEGELLYSFDPALAASANSRTAASVRARSCA